VMPCGVVNSTTVFLGDSQGIGKILFPPFYGSIPS
jgi:hypothetical protein